MRKEKRWEKVAAKKNGIGSRTTRTKQNKKRKRRGKDERCGKKTLEGDERGGQNAHLELARCGVSVEVSSLPRAGGQGEKRGIKEG